MKNLIFLACALCAVQAVPVPSAEQPNELEILQIPLQGNKVCVVLFENITWFLRLSNCSLICSFCNVSILR